jgi:protein-S-isoprenylcysteine O-methyltransferase Ste14
MTLPADTATFHAWATWAEIGLAVVTIASLFVVVAPYGRHDREGWGPKIPSRLAWIYMECPAVLAFGWWFLRGPHATATAPLVLFALWNLHYVHRTFVFPFRLKIAGKTMPFLIATLGFTFNTLNAYVNATWIGTLGDYPASWLGSPAFVVGATLFLSGLAINLWSDTRLIELRGDGTGGYKVPRGGLFELVSCPNYLGEILEWTGWAIATWSLAGVAFLLYVLANLVPRALANHAWYREKFPDYPARRRALVPFVL